MVVVVARRTGGGDERNGAGLEQRPLAPFRRVLADAVVVVAAPPAQADAHLNAHHFPSSVRHFPDLTLHLSIYLATVK